MTEQLVETEQQFLGNEPKPARLEDAILKTFAGKPLDAGQQAVLDKAMQHYAPNAHRIHAHPIAELAPDERSGLATKFLGAIDTAFDKADHSLAGSRGADVVYHRPTADAIFRKSVAAAAKLHQARAAAKQAEDAMSEALAVENLAEIDSVEADRALLEYVREVAAQ